VSQRNDWLLEPVAKLDAVAQHAAETRQADLTKPPGALGSLEQLAIQLSAMQGTEQPVLDQLHIVVFAGDHGVVAEGVSAFPQTVTNQMINNFARGGAAINVLARELNAKLEIVNLGTVNNDDCPDSVLNLQLGEGTANICQAPAMQEDQLADALSAGQHAVERANSDGAELFIGGEMGIGNTTSAAALACVLLGASAEQLAGPGTGLNTKGVAHKSKVIDKALQLHTSSIKTPLDALCRLGGFEIAALTGCYIRCAQLGIPVLIDGFISSVAALTAFRQFPGVANWFIYSHCSAEPGHTLILDALSAQPLLSLGMCLGEGSGAAMAVPLLRLACSLHNNMATFSEAGISGKPG
jgi:nicotinate-nucleotide--dimethylbenzimidazole phosphoribosyltransferase